MLIDLYEINLSVEQKDLLKKGYSAEIIDNVSTYKIRYLSGDTKVSGYLSYPNYPKKKYPVIIWNRGGYKRSGRLDDFLASGILGEIASWDFAVLASNYRMNDEIGGKDVDDVINLIEVAREFPFTDCDKMGMEGWSRGGMMTYKALQRTADIKCTIIVSGLADMRRSVEINSSLRKMVSSLNLSDYDDFIYSRTSLNFTDKINVAVPIFFIHGTGDTRISYKDSVEMYDALSKRNKDTEYKIKLIDNGDHVLRRHRKLVSELKRNWYNKYLY
ncbi:MAG: prolyl oligopeptidase family serine peptidase [Ignavibacteria bacterium]|nr:prolyl oligopeptidase family serine peptidase [Ignavibacteria bacterium]